MIEITIQGKHIDLPEDFILEIEDSSPIFNDAGPMSIDVTIPASANNLRLLGFPNRPDSIGGARPANVKCLVCSGAYIRSGIINVDSASGSSIGINIGFCNSIAYDSWKEKNLADISSLPCMKFETMAALKSYIMNLYNYGNPQEEFLAVFPICLGVENANNDAGVEREYPEIINPTGMKVFRTAEDQELTVVRVIDNVPTVVTVPDGYACTPFVRVWKILECVFRDLGLKLDSNPFKEDIQLARLVVLNNTADAVCTGTIDLAELMPDCSVDDFLQALYVRFGLVYFTDFDKSVVNIRLLKDIVASESACDLDGWLSETPSSQFITPQYVKLSAGTSLEGAAPLTPRLEDFLRGFDASNLFCGDSVNEWTDRTPSDSFFEHWQDSWDGDDPRDDYDPWEDYDPGYDYDFYDTRAGETADQNDSPDYELISRSSKPKKEGFHFVWDLQSGKWYRTSMSQGVKINEESTSFFDWNPMPTGYAALELNSPDECCPLGYFQEGFKDTLMPAFFTGSRHFHSYIGTDKDENNAECPLSFMFAMTGMADVSATIGRLSADRGIDKPPSIFRDGSTHDLSLCFQYRNGLYANFWKDFDMALRAADRKVSAKCRISKADLLGMDILSRMKLGGVPMLIDSAEISIGTTGLSSADLTLMPAMMPYKDYDPGENDSEIPDFPPERVLSNE